MRTRGALAEVALWQVTTHSSPTAKSTEVDHCPVVMIERGVLDTTVGANPDTASEPTTGKTSLLVWMTGANSVVTNDPVEGVTLMSAVATTTGANSAVASATVAGVTLTCAVAAAVGANSVVTNEAVAGVTLM